jgi:hypothetical protein
MQHLTALLEELKNKPFRVSTNKNGEAIQQTERNALKNDLLNAIRQDIAECYEYVYQNEDGILLEIANSSIADNISNEEGSGAITACVDIKIKNLDFNATTESEDYMRKVNEKAEKQKAKDEKKNAKIARDKAMRASKKKEEEEE